MKKRVIIALTFIISLVVLLYLGVCMLSSQDDIKPDRTSGRLCYLPILNSPGEVELIPGLRFKIDTGSDLSTITMSDLELLDSLGFEVHKKIYPVVGRDGA